MSTERQHGRDIVSFGRALHERGYVAAMDGNLSVRLGENRILATPTAMCKGVMRPSDLVIVDMQGRRLGGHPSPGPSVRRSRHAQRERAPRRHPLVPAAQGRCRAAPSKGA